MHITRHVKWLRILLAVVLAIPSRVTLSSQSDIVLTGVHEAALDLPRVFFVLQREPDGPYLAPLDDFGLNYAFLDTGASGILLSRETTEQMHITVHPDARFADVGVGGNEYFNVSEPLYLRIAGYDEKHPEDPRAYRLASRGRFQVRRNKAGLLSEPLDIIGMPGMFNRVVVLDSAATNSLEYFTARIRNPDDPDIPKVHLRVPLRLRNFLNPRNPENIAPLPIMARNPVIDDIVVVHNNQTSGGQWLLDTGGTISLISVRQAAGLGLTNDDGKPLVEPDFTLPVGGIGTMVRIPGFEVDRLVLPTVSGRRLVFKEARIGVHDIVFYNEKEQEYEALDGVFGSNFLCASAEMQGLLPGDINETVFDKVVIDLHGMTLGFRFRRPPQD